MESFLINDMCRLCCQTKTSFVPIYQDNPFNLKRALAQTLLPKVQVEENDGKPQKVCFDCCHKLLEAETFIDQCIQADHKFNLYLKQAPPSDSQDLSQTHGDSHLKIISLMEQTANETNNGELDEDHHETEGIVEEVIIEFFEDDSEASPDQKHENNESIGIGDVISSSDQCSNDAIRLDGSQDTEPSGNRPNSTEPVVKRRRRRRRKGSEPPCLICPICQRKLSSESRLKSHLDTHTGEKKHKCSKCCNAYYQSSDLRRHMKVHDKVHSCPYCDKCFMQNGHLDRHIQMHTGFKPVQCSLCCKLLASKHSLSYHLNYHATTEIYEKFECSLCTGRFKSKWSLREHYEKLHLQPMPEKIQCSICDKKFEWKEDYKVHIKQHNLETGVYV